MKNFALIVGGVVVIGIVVALLTGNMDTILNSVWNWVFSVMGASSPPAAPF